MGARQAAAFVPCPFARLAATRARSLFSLLLILQQHHAFGAGAAAPPQTQTATLQKDGGGSGGWRPKEFVFKVQALRGERGGFW